MIRSVAFPWPSLFPALVFLTACGANDHPQQTPATPGPSSPVPHEHLDRVALGELTLGPHRFAVFQVAPIAPGQEADFDLDFPTAELPKAIRGWIGPESGHGVAKALFRKETAQRLHGHPEVPAPIPADSAIWFEAETASGPARASLPLPR